MFTSPNTMAPIDLPAQKTLARVAHHPTDEPLSSLAPGRTPSPSTTKPVAIYRPKYDSRALRGQLVFPEIVFDIQRETIDTQHTFLSTLHEVDEDLCLIHEAIDDAEDLCLYNSPASTTSTYRGHSPLFFNTNDLSDGESDSSSSAWNDASVLEEANMLFDSLQRDGAFPNDMTGLLSDEEEEAQEVDFGELNLPAHLFQILPVDTTPFVDTENAPSKLHSFNTSHNLGDNGNLRKLKRALDNQHQYDEMVAAKIQLLTKTIGNMKRLRAINRTKLDSTREQIRRRENQADTSHFFGELNHGANKSYIS